MLAKNLIRASLKAKSFQLASISNTAANSNRNRYAEFAAKERFTLPTRPLKYQNEELTPVVESPEDYKFVEKLIPSQIVPEPPQHESYPTPSGWVPVNIEKSSRLPYAVLRTRFHQFPMYAIEREGGSRKLVRIKNIEGDIWEFDKDLRSFLEKCIQENEERPRKIYTSVNEVQRQVLVKGHYMEYISSFLKECGF